ncbi:similar to Saccharomyces cerevisiae YGL216W KIP3 Kinesin-related motor protein involved in mitotic spindle positioning [Maudiozyma barnettii]|uniref:Kinesin-like protein n=1 Tax=Maudiozyma barnettii TaxID=61262 RepID=A0A8H2VB42_9SACH|nr:tubulin-dependent ATPase KIP3 [Kazachstania barnettii]CAB4251982.1 similar to Saccharomyces cerevisiae YGL216W KIP3 Kinesin-related motor protein involved in mitotic spindle positioning [Kazachstania barnettii]CAD1778383.1 similar to Saccharomyces cerevisiae YGL216W KIP3 Kinesin-related motor protein involved in mitotic spindle positioning [Kazachstania barnettii]
MDPSSVGRQSSITVAVRVRPFNDMELSNLISIDQSIKTKLTNFPYPINFSNGKKNESTSVTGDSSILLPNDLKENDNENNNTTNSNNNKMIRSNGIWKLIDCVDDKMLVFDPIDRTPLNLMSENVLNSAYFQRRKNRQRRRRTLKTTNIYNNNTGSQNNISRRQFGKIDDDSGEIKFVFDKLFDDNSTQQEVYQSTTSPLITSVLEGFNATIFAYGATGCGKTYTVSGTPEAPGIIFQAMQELFDKIDSLNDTQTFEISLSFLEIYNERIRDLLNPETNSKRLIIREDDNQRTTVANLSHHYPKTVQDVIDLVIKGNINRTTSPTEANEVSSRSHSVLQVHIIQTNKTIDLTSHHKYATLSIIDLAGSERAASTKNRGKRLNEGANINRSLLALGNCINALCISDNTNEMMINGNHKRSYHIPYRDSKLTRLLKFSLGGNCKTVMIVCISPSSSHYDETLNTLKYANRAKEIKTKIIRNQQSLNKHVSSYLKMITEQKLEIEQLRLRESQMIELKLNELKLNYQKIERQMKEIFNNIEYQYKTNERYITLKNLRSLTLVKRRFLQLIKIEIDNVMNYFTDREIHKNCELIQLQIFEKIKELEIKFDSNDELNLVIKHVKEVDYLKLKEMENWDESIYENLFETKLLQIEESLRNEIMINSSIIIEKLFNDEKLLKRFKFFSECLINEHDINLILQDLVNIDKEFDEFAEQFLIIQQNGNTTDKQKKKKLRWSDSLIESVIPKFPTKNIILSDSMEIDMSLQDTTMTTQDSLKNEENKVVDTSYNNNNSNIEDRSIINENENGNNGNRNSNNISGSSILLRRNFLTDDS